MTFLYLGSNNNSDGGSFCMRITNIAGGRPDDASLRDSLPYRSPRQPCCLPRHCQVIVTVTVVAGCHWLVIVRLLPLFLSDIAIAILIACVIVIVTSSAYKS